MLGRLLKFRHVALLTTALVPTGAAYAGLAPVVDVQASSPVTNVSREQLENLPTGRRVEDLIRTCPAQTIPTVSSEPQILIDGVLTSPTASLNCVQPDDVRMIEVYKAHNSLRAEYGVTPLQWNPVLADHAQTFANQLGQTGQLVHASREGRGTERENISQGLPNWNVNQLMGSWLNERQYFRAGIFPNVSTTGDWYQVGHYSQIIWPTTTDIGCGIGMGRGSSWLVCRYNPGGNKDGKPVGTQPQIAQGQDGPAQRASLFDLGIYAGRAWTTDWFDIGGDTLGVDAPGGYNVAEAFAELRIPLLRDAPFFEDGQYQELFTEDEYRAALERGNKLSTPPPDDPWLQDTLTMGNWSTNGGVRFDLYDSDSPPLPASFLDFGIQTGSADAGAFGYRDVPGALDIFPYSHNIFASDKIALSDDIFLDLPSQGTTEMPVDTKVEQPTLPPTEVFNPNQPKAAQPTAKYEPSNPNTCNAMRFWDAEKMYQEAKAKGDQGAMTAAKGYMANAIMRQYEAVEAGVEAGEMASINVWSAADFLGKFMESYKDLTGELPPGYYDPPNGFMLEDGVIKPVDTAVEQPQLPPAEVFKPEEQKNIQCDLM